MWKPVAQADSLLRAQKQLQNSVILISSAYLREGSTPSFINSTEPALASPAEMCTTSSGCHLLPVVWFTDIRQLKVVDSAVTLWLMSSPCLAEPHHSRTAFSLRFGCCDLTVIFPVLIYFKQLGFFSAWVSFRWKGANLPFSVFCVSVWLSEDLGYELVWSELLS